MIISRTFCYLWTVITPLILGIVVSLIGLSLIKVGVVSCSGGHGAMDDGTFGTVATVDRPEGDACLGSQSAFGVGS